MKKIGFIDYYLSEWHADNYPEMIKNTGLGYEVCYAYAHTEPPIDGRLSNREWSEKYGIALVDTMEELVEKSDCIIVLSPDNPEMHEELSDLALRSGKPVYIDKTFAPNLAAAKRLFEKAEKYGTPMYSASSLNFADELYEFERNGIKSVTTVWTGNYDTHLIHQIEPAVVLINSNPQTAVYTNNGAPSVEVIFENGAKAHMTIAESEYVLKVGYEHEKVCQKTIESPFFDNFIKAMLKFFDTKIPPVSKQQTLRVIAAVEAALKAEKTPGKEIIIL